MSHYLPIEKGETKLTVQRGRFGGLDMAKRPEANGFSTCMNLDVSQLPDLVGHCRWIDRSLSTADVKVHLGLFSVGDWLYLVGYDGAHIAIYRVGDNGYQLIHAFSETMTETEATALPLWVSFCHPLYGGAAQRTVYLYPFGYSISLDANGSMVSFSRLSEEVSKLNLRCVLLHQNRMFATDGHKIFASAVNSTTDFTSFDAEDPSAAWSAVVTDDTSTAVPVLGLTRFQGKLYYFCKESFGIIRGGENPFRTESLFDVGTVNIRSVAAMDDKLFFLSSKGLMIFDGQKVRCVSGKLGIEHFANGVGGVWKGQYYLGLPSVPLGAIYTYCVENENWGSMLCYGNPVLFTNSGNSFCFLCNFSGSDTVYLLGQTPNGFSGQTVPFSLPTLSERQLRAVRIMLEPHDAEKINCDLIVTRRDGTKSTYPLFSDVVGTTRKILTKRLSDIWGISFAFSIRATGGAVVSDFELIFAQGEEIV